ncbi:MAG: type II toxin-antitoxin system RelE/ParE family toxin [Rikenellaceae bacterium]|jgi:plasmid stabilization system protein ParE|nr:type II toxin-antitoxin system RelE/ParE family toxin [Rikenellaceae bacterium]
MKISWLRFASENLETIYQTLEGLNARAAAELYNDILDEVEKLSVFPEMASVESLLEKEPEKFRSLVVRRRYKIIYFIEAETIIIVAVWDCHQDPETLAKKIARRGKE